MLLEKKNISITQTSLVNRLIKAMGALITTVENENKLLENGELSNIETVIEKKISCLQEFNEIQYDVEQFVRSNKINKSDPIMVKLKSYFTKLDEINRRNEILLRTNIEVSNKIVEMYKVRRTESTIRQFGYNKEGNVTVSKNLEKVMPSISLNNKV